MRKHIRKALRVKGHKFYLSPRNIDYGHWLPECTMTTKKRVRKFLDMVTLMNYCEGVHTEHGANYTVIFFNHARRNKEMRNV